MTPGRQPTPNYKFRMLCKRCNSYLHTGVEVLPLGALLLWFEECDVEADSLDEEFEPVRDQ